VIYLREFASICGQILLRWKWRMAGTGGKIAESIRYSFGFAAGSLPIVVIGILNS
jgi:hypothetical protein